MRPWTDYTKEVSKKAILSYCSFKYSCYAMQSTNAKALVERHANLLKISEVNLLSKFVVIN